MDPKIGPPPVETISSSYDAAYPPPEPSYPSAPQVPQPGVSFQSQAPPPHGPPPSYPGPEQGAFPPQPTYQQPGMGAGQPPNQSGPPPMYQPPPPQYPGGGAPGYGQVPPPAQPGYGQAGSGQPPALYPQQQRFMPAGSVTVVTGVGVRRGAHFGPHNQSMVCPHCQANITTNIDRQMGTMVWVIFGAIILFGLFIFPFVLLGCCFIPFCIPSLKDVEHSCPNCNKYLGKYERMR